MACFFYGGGYDGMTNNSKKSPKKDTTEFNFSVIL